METLSRLSVILFYSLISTGLFAQQGQRMRITDPEESAKRQLDTMKEIIKIDAKEEEKVKEIFLNAAKEMQKLRSGMQEGGDREAMKTRMTEINKKRDAELEKLLGRERIEKYVKELEKRRQERGNSRR